MPLDVGTRLGPYEIVVLIGAGGMGEVYRARDTRLGRDVAVKILPRAVTADPRSTSPLRARSAHPGGAQSPEHRHDSSVRLGALGERLGTSLDHPNVDSVSGLVLALLGRPARVGDAVTFGGYRFEVAAVHGFGVAECAVRPSGDGPSAATD